MDSFGKKSEEQISSFNIPEAMVNILIKERGNIPLETI